MAYKYSISREQYKKIKKMDHRQLDEFIVSYGKNLIDYDDSKKIEKQVEEKSNKTVDTTKIIDDTKAMCYEAMMIAIENTKGIGEKIKANFISEYEKAMSERQ